MEQLTLDQQRIVSENHNLIYSLANKKSINLDEYYDVLAIGLCKAAIAFDNTKGKFSTLAYTVMLNEYKQELRNSRMREQFRKINYFHLMFQFRQIKIANLQVLQMLFQIIMFK